MARIKYYYDTETCKYERVRTSITERIINILALFIVTMCIAVGLVFLYIKFIPSKKGRQLAKENDQLENHITILDKKLGDSQAYLEYLAKKDEELYLSITGAKLETELDQSHVNFQELINNDETEDRYIKLELKKMDQLLAHAKNRKNFNEVYELLAQKVDTLPSIPSILPVYDKELKQLASGFGKRTHPIYKVIIEHEGVDFSAPEGTPVFATADGVVSYVTKKDVQNGRYIELKHSLGYKTTYAHLKSYIVSPGQKVKRGDVIGYIGITGKAVSPHLGYEIIYKGKKVNPIHYFHLNIKKIDYFKLKKMASIENQTLS